jgi:succinate-acetate transporter protein
MPLKQSVSGTRRSMEQPPSVSHEDARAVLGHAPIPSGPYRVVLRPVATPMPLGFLAQAVASVSLASVQLGWVGATQAHPVAWAVLVLTVPLQLISAVVGFLARDPVATTGTGLLAGGWAAVAVAALTSTPGTSSPGLGVVLLALSAALLVPAAAGVTKAAAAMVLLLSAARFAATGLHQLTASPAWQQTAGWVGIALAAVSSYAALAFELEASAGHALLPTLRWGAARRAEQPGLEHQLRGVDTEPGVREVL